MYLLFALNEGSDTRVFLARFETSIKCLKAINATDYTNHEIHDVRNDEWFEFVRRSDNKIQMRICEPTGGRENWTGVERYEDAVKYFKRETFWQRIGRCMR